jgi:hypothetical protein
MRLTLASFFVDRDRIAKLADSAKQNVSRAAAVARERDQVDPIEFAPHHSRHCAAWRKPELCSRHLPIVPISIALAVQNHVSESRATSALFLSVIDSIFRLGAFIALTHSALLQRAPRNDSRQSPR